MAKIDNFLRAGLAMRASDVHFAAGEPIRARVDGDLTVMNFPVLEARELQDILFEILSDGERQRFLAHKNIDKSYVFDTIGFFRVNLFMTRKGISGVFRAIPQRIPSPDELGLPSSLKSLADLSKGLVLVTGPTGSGKSTTLAALIGHINANYRYHILTAEDPVEFVHQSQKSLVNQREIGASCPTFADALKYALREDPDVILVGEMRDLETISLALTAAETGHLVFGTLHTRGAAPSIDRIIDSFPANQQAMIRTMLAESLVAVVSQALLRRSDNKGRIAAYEIMVVNHAISNLIREGKSFQIPSIIQTARKEGMVLMDQYIAELVERGIVTPEEAEFYVEDISIVRARAKMAQQKGSMVSQIPTFSAFAKVPIPAQAPAAAAPARHAPAPSPQPQAAQPAAPVAKPPTAGTGQTRVQAVPRPAPIPAPAPIPKAPPPPAAPEQPLVQSLLEEDEAPVEKTIAAPRPPATPTETKTAPAGPAKNSFQNAFRSAPPPTHPDSKMDPTVVAKPAVLTDLTEEEGVKSGEEFMEDMEGYSRIIEVGTVRDSEGNLSGPKVNDVLDPFNKKTTNTNTGVTKLPTPPPIPKKKAG